MSTTPFLSAAALAALLVPFAAAQAPAPALDEFFVPLHSHPGDPGYGDPGYGTWAAGPDWKARFDHGFTFIAWLGADAPRSLPWRFQSLGVRQGDAWLPASADATAGSPNAQRYELRHAGFVERYDVSPQGVEQSFVVDAPLGEGDLIVEGTVTSELRAASVAFRHGALEFTTPDGADALRYGAAFAIDAAGRRLPIDTAYDGERIALRVPGEWLASAAWPLTIDPLTSTTTIQSFVSNIVATTLCSAPQHAEHCVAFTRRFAANDHDLYVRTMALDYSARQTVYTDFADDRDTEHVSADWVAGANRHVVAFDVQQGDDSFVRLYFHAGGVGNALVGPTLDVNPPSGFEFRTPSFGGTQFNTSSGYLALRRDPSGATRNSDSSRVFGALVDAGSFTRGTLNDLHTAAEIVSYDADWPCVSRASEYSDGWVVVWQEYNFANSGDDWDVIAQRVQANGTRVGWTALGFDGVSQTHRMRPKVAGTGADFCVAFTAAPNFGTKPSGGDGSAIYAQTFAWPAYLGLPTETGSSRGVATAPGLLLALGDGTDNLAFDRDGNSHWSLIWNELGVAQRIARLGYEAGVAEAAVLQVEDGTLHTFTGAAFYEESGNHFAVVTSAQGGIAPVHGRDFEFGASGASAFGVSCAGTLQFRRSSGPWLPHAGSGNAILHLDNARPFSATWLFLSLGPADLPLPQAGAGCRLLLDPNVLFAEIALDLTDAQGDHDFSIALPSFLYPANLYWQCIQLDGGQLASSTALLTELR